MPNWKVLTADGDQSRLNDAIRACEVQVPAAGELALVHSLQSLARELGVTYQCVLNNLRRTGWEGRQVYLLTRSTVPVRVERGTDQATDPGTCEEQGPGHGADTARGVNADPSGGTDEDPTPTE